MQHVPMRVSECVIAILLEILLSSRSCDLGLKKADKYFVPVLRLMLKAKFSPSSVGLQAPVTLKRRLGRSEDLQNSLV